MKRMCILILTLALPAGCTYGPEAEASAGAGDGEAGPGIKKGFSSAETLV